jgi:hypothetical protein
VLRDLPAKALVQLVVAVHHGLISVYMSLEAS